MNKGRNILLILTCLLTISVLSFFTLFERNNNGGVVDGVRYILDSEEDGVRTYTFYFEDPDVTADCMATVEEEKITYLVGDVSYVYAFGSDTVTASDDNAFGTYSEDLFRQMSVGKEKFMKYWQAAIVFAICFAGGAIILNAEEIWHVIHRKGEDEWPEWDEMKGIKITGGAVIAAGVILMIIFVLV